MSIVNIDEVTGGTGTLDWKVRRTYVRKFKVYCSSNSDTAATILASQSGTGDNTHIPARLSVYPGDSLALVKQINVSRTNDPLIWDVEHQYDSLFEFDPATTNENPLSRPVIVEFSFEKYTRSVREDLDGEAIQNKAGTPIDPPLEEELSIPIISISYNLATFDFDTVSDVQDCVNDDTWHGFDQWTVKVRGLTVKKMWENNVLFWAVNWTLAVKWDGWRPTKVLNMGYYELGDDGEPKIIRDKFGQPLPNPSLLDEDGKKLPTGEDPVYLEFALHREIDFTTTIGF